MNIIDLLDISAKTGEEISLIHDLYISIDNRMRHFAAEYGIKCPAGCGKCCEKYEPEISQSEAVFAAAWIIKNNPSLSSLFPAIPERKNCIFYNRDNPEHCMIYEARPLLCRAFAFSGLQDKHGKRRYKSCTFMEEKKELAGDFIPLMTREGTRIIFESTESDKPAPLSVAIEKAWQKLSFILLIASIENNPGLNPLNTSAS